MPLSVASRTADGAHLIRTQWDPETGSEVWEPNPIVPRGTTFYSRISRPDPEKRLRPTDLFAAWTSREVASITATYGTVGYFRDRNDSLYKGVPCSFWATPSDPVEAYNFDQELLDYRELDARMRTRIKSASANLAQNCAEYRQTCNMFANAARDVVSTFHSLRNGRAFGDFVSALQSPHGTKARALSNKWLEYQHGLRPLVQDIYDASSALANTLRRGIPIYLRSSIHRKSTWFDASSWYTGTHEVSGIQRIVLRYTYDPGILPELGRFGITNPALLAWELVPYSFVFDQIIPVGDYLASLDAMIGVSSLVVGRSSSRTDRFKGRISIGSGANVEQVKIKHVREPLGSSLSLPPLRYQPSKSLMSVLNGLALLTQLRTGRAK